MDSGAILRAMARAVKRKRPYNVSLRQEQAQITRQRLLDATRRLMATGAYSTVTMEEIAKNAGVAYQTVYAIFGTKLQLAKDMIQAGFHFEGLPELVARANAAADPEAALRIGAQISPLIHETCADVVRFMRESGDAELLTRYHQNEELRLTQEAHIPALLRASGSLRPALSDPVAPSVVWAMTGTDFYALLVFQRGWTPSQYEEWLGSALISLLLEPAERAKASIPS